MQYRRMGKSGLKVSACALGGLYFGSKVNESTAMEIVDKALDAGVNFVDTADIYGKESIYSQDRGRSEEIVGKAIKGRRQSVVLATKIEAPAGPGVNDRGLNRKHIRQGVEESLRRLQADYIDIYYAHSPDYSTPIEETLRAFDDLVHQGKVLYLGMSNYYAWQVSKALGYSDKNHMAGVACIQMVYNVIARGSEYEMLHLCESEGIGVNIWDALAGGMLTGKFLQYSPNKPPPDGVKPYPSAWTPGYFEAVTRLKKNC
jgi:1-deoxyxylulose-5-phosphate synthase